MFVASLKVITSLGNEVFLEQADCKQAFVGHICPLSACVRLD